MQAGAQGHDCDDEFGRVAESCVHQSANTRAQMFGDPLRSPAHPSCKRNDSDRGRDKDVEGVRLYEFQHKRRRNHYQQPVQNVFQDEMGLPGTGPCLMAFMASASIEATSVRLAGTTRVFPSFAILPSWLMYCSATRSCTACDPPGDWIADASWRI